MIQKTTGVISTSGSAHNAGMATKAIGGIPTSYEAFLMGDQEDRDDDLRDAEIEAERAARAEAKRTAPKRDETPH